MVNSIKLIQTPSHQFNFLGEFTRNKQLQELRKRLEKGIFFKPGINVLIGENGCGKSTILNIIRSANRIEHSFVPKLDHLEITTITELNRLFKAFEIKQDYRYAVFNLYRLFEDKKLIGSSSGLDTLEKTKLFLAGNEESKGQNVLGDINQLWDWMFNHQEECFPMWKYIQDIHNKGVFKDTFTSSNGLAVRGEEETSTLLMKAIQSNHINCEPNIFTVLMDEPDQGLDIDNLEQIYSIVSFDKPNTQLIVSIHNPILIHRLSKLDYINFIEVSNGYLEKVKKFVEG